MLSMTDEMGRGLPHIRRAWLWEMSAVIPGHIQIIPCQIRAYGFRMYPVKIVICLSVWSHCQIKITGAHLQRPEIFPHHGIWPQDVIRRQNGNGLPG